MSALAAGLCALGGAWASPALAQCSIPTNVVTMTSITPAGQAAIAACADAAKAAFADDDDAAIRDLRRSVLVPLQDATFVPSVAFRTAYESAMNPVLAPVATGTNEYAAINALVIAGELCAGNSLSVLQAGLKDKRPAVRMEAASGHTRTFQILRGQQAPSILPARVSDSIRALGEALAGEEDAMAADGIVTALQEATRLGATTLPGVANSALTELATRATSIMQRPDAGVPMLRALLRAASTAQDAVGVQRGAVVVDAPMAQLLKSFAAAGVTFADRLGKAEGLSEDDRRLAQTLLERFRNIQGLLESRQGASASRGG